MNLPTFKKQLIDRHKKRISKGAKEERYFGKVAKQIDKKDMEYRK